MYTALRRFYKQIVIGTVFLAVALGVSVWIWHATRPRPSCFDSIKNQNEEGVDCGGICALACKREPAYPSVSVTRAKFFKVSESGYDVLGEIENKNSDFGSPSFEYEFTLLNGAGEALNSRRGMSYVLPQEKKYIAERRLETLEPAASARLSVFDEQWVEIEELESANLFIGNKEFSAVRENGSFAGYRASGVAVNQTGFDFDQIDIVVVLRDDSGEALSVGSTDMRTLKNGDRRFFEVRWPFLPDNSAMRLDTYIYTNLLANENFLVRYGKRRGRFQDEAPSPTPRAPK